MNTGSAAVRGGRLADQLDRWAKDTGQALARLPRVVDARLKSEGRKLLATVRASAPIGRGELRRSLAVRHSKNTETLSMPGKYAPLEFGGLIRPSKARFLAVPVSAGARSFRGPRQDGALFALTLKDGRRFLARPGSLGFEIRWRLIEQVKITGRGFVTAAMRKSATSFPSEVLGAMTKEVMRG